MRATRRGRVPVVVQTPRGRRRRGPAARALWLSAETLVTCGVLVLLLVVHQLWWTNEQARAQADRQVRNLERAWDSSPLPEPTVEPVPEPLPESPGPPPAETAEPEAPAATRAAPPEEDAAYAVLRIPRLGLTVPVAPGVSRRGVLDRGYVGHYPGTGAPGRTGNFALAGHRNTHGEPFRHLDRLRPGDAITVRTREGTSTYRVDRILPVTSPRDVGVIAPVPRSLYKPEYGYDRPGAYLTLTTCTPEFTSTYRLVVWARLVTTAPSSPSAAEANSAA
ncbi:class E sortase [Streptomyces sp. NPDC053541]|uniref:class E sortase n=1 Tax=Streptomyces sp. NPDC053541 TaxID=3365709 RepID=UPI0037D6E1B7